jgi:hypothetical protein
VATPLGFDTSWRRLSKLCGPADTLLALAWTQYQYFFFPMIFGYLGFRLLREDWRQCHSKVAVSASS